MCLRGSTLAASLKPISPRKPMMIQKIKLPDAIIYATAKLTQSDLITRNTQDFQNIDEEVKIVNPY
jgi:predicted nucleic acid-binding protein